MDIRSVKRNYSIQQWKSIIQNRNNSGMTVDAYCKQNGLSRHSYFYWLRIIREEALEQSSDSGFCHIYLYTGYTDLQNGIDGLIAVVNGTFGLDPAEEGSIFLFCGRKTDRIKALLFEGDGWLLCYKRLTGAGRFQWPGNEQEAKQSSPGSSAG